MVREPVDRLISIFYYLRLRKRFKGKNDVPPVSWFEKSFDECVLTNDPECRVESLSETLELQLTYFCGKWRECGNISSPASLQLAKYNVETQYSVVGVMERFNTSLKVMEILLPRWFLGVTQLNRAEKRNKNSHPGVRDTVREMVKKRLKNELEFYGFIKQRLSLQERKYL